MTTILYDMLTKMTKTYCINPENGGQIRTVSVEGNTEREIKLKLLNYIIDKLNLDVEEILSELSYNGHFDYLEIRETCDKI